MRLSTRSYYGLRAIICLAKENKSCSVKTISSKERIPEKYLEKIFQELKSAGFLVSHKGAGGGYFLSRPAAKIKAKEIVMVLEKDQALTRCQESCPMASKCSAKTFWQEMEQSFESSFGSTTLANLISKKHAKN